MLTIVWNTIGFHLIDAIPEGEKYSARYFIDKILTLICGGLIPHSTRKVVIHADNARCDNAKAVLEFVPQPKVRLALHPPYSPHLAPSGFFLFGYLRREL
jgi:hypothetical protein